MGLWAALALGCGSSKPVVVDSVASQKNLQRIAGAYAMFAAKQGRPPKDLNDLKPQLEGGPDKLVASEVLRSPDDGEEYVIIYGVSVIELAQKGINPNVVIAYEKNGSGGKRWVLKMPSQVLQMTDAEFKKAPFPPGSQPPA
jgi:hypothetical protein